MTGPRFATLLLSVLAFSGCSGDSNDSSEQPGGAGGGPGPGGGTGGLAAAAGGALPGGAGGDATPGAGGASVSGNGGSTVVSGGAPGTGGTPAAGGSVVGAGGQGGGPPDAGGGVALPPENAGFDYQLGGAYAPPPGVSIVSRDRTDSIAPGLYNICYVNGLQIQPGEEGSWDPDLMLRDSGGNPVIDPDWNEVLLDVSTADKRTRIAAVVGGWIGGCAGNGFDAVEIDNLDTYSRSGGRISQNDAVAYLALLSARAHAEGLAIAQKNSTEILSRRSEMGTDFAVAEECSRYQECGDYVSVYGAHVLMIEYRDADFAAGCQAYGATHSIVRRDLNLVPAGRPAYVFDGC